MCSFTSNVGVEGVLASHSAEVLASAVLMRVLVAQCAFMRGGAGGAGGGGGGAIGTYWGITAGYGAAYIGGAV